MFPVVGGCRDGEVLQKISQSLFLGSNQEWWGLILCSSDAAVRALIPVSQPGPIKNYAYEIMKTALKTALLRRRKSVLAPPG